MENKPEPIIQKYNSTDLDTRKTIATDCNSPPEILGELSLDENRDIRLLVASNPNTPAEVLFQLSEEFPEAVTGNPIFDILVLENPGSHSIRLCLARSSTTSEETLARLADTVKADDMEILGAIALNPNTPIHILEKLATWYLKDDYHDYTEDLRKGVAVNPKTPLALLEKLVHDLNYNVREAVAKNPNTSVSILEKLAGEQTLGISQAIVENSKTPISIVKKVAHNISDEICETIAKERDIWAWVLDQLTGDELSNLLQAIIEESKTPKPALKWLARKNDKEIRQTVLAALNINRMMINYLPF